MYCSSHEIERSVEETDINCTGRSRPPVVWTEIVDISIKLMYECTGSSIVVDTSKCHTLKSQKTVKARFEGGSIVRPDAHTPSS
jgi:hypothetical protein